MRLDNKEVSIALVGAGFILLLAYLGWSRSNTGQPRYESPTGSAGAGLFGVIDSLDTGDHYFHPVHCVPGQTQIFTPHKYPDLCGGNISTLFHYGMDQLSVPAPQDNDWINYPPAEVQFLCISSLLTLWRLSALSLSRWRLCISRGACCERVSARASASAYPLWR